MKKKKRWKKKVTIQYRAWYLLLRPWKDVNFTKMGNYAWVNKSNYGIEKTEE